MEPGYLVDRFRVCGHAIGGFLIAGMGNTGTLIVISSLMVIAFLALWQLGLKPALNEKGQKSPWESVKEGLRFVFNTKELLGAMSLDLFAVLFGGAAAMIPVFARDILRVGPQGFGLLNSSSDIGSILIVIMLTFFPFRKKQGQILFFAVAGFGACIIIFGLSKIFWLSFSALLISGMLGRHQRSNQGYHYAAQNARPGKGQGHERKFHVYQFQQ